ncbi:hypothetical protein TTHERM_00399170 (macronuclear) [Tetrahymena thermophila SB210]|uniref:Uncharacterized protein n=1 Tax=Tetrahymena thermophila (strain SB210) TaxID=312017 RepID=I7MIJ2_TETTS|nr:hypothetical protein TTHERM_00399170 [Tetrahymena thermophila SB210]EAR93748.1 hypothetical protein TTHERM_00399170 [Tetrahymena thermophila SB210]|eukprot:XP_001013993.1 hypothetical protein TTHERM_00399170 [Tetrahymena thermophila SB210]
MNNSNIFDGHQYTLATQEIKEQVIYMTEVLKGERNFLNKHFQNAITNYFMEDYASQFLKEKMNLKTYKEVKNVISQKLEERKKSEYPGTKYMNLINIYYEEHSKWDTLQLYQNYLRDLALSNEDKNYKQGSQEWITVCWKKATALFVLHHSLNPSLSSIFEIWNSLYPEDPIIKKKKTKEERDKEKMREQIKEQGSCDYQDSYSVVKKGKKGIQKNKTQIDRSSLNKQKDIQLWRKNNKKQSPHNPNSDQEENNQFDNNSDEKYSQNSSDNNNFNNNNNNRDQIIKQANQKKKFQNNKTKVEDQENNQLVESLTDVKDSIHLFKERIIKENGGEGFDAFPDFEYIPMTSKINQESNTTNSIIVQQMDQEKIKEEYQNRSFLGCMDIEQSKDKDSIFKSLIFAKGNQVGGNINLNLNLNQNQNNNTQQQQQQQQQQQPQSSLLINQSQPIFENEDFFAKNMNIFQDIGFGDLNNELQMFESQKNPTMKVNLPIFNSLTFSAMNMNNNFNLNLLSNNNLNSTLYQQNNIFGSKFYQQLEEQQVTNSLQFLRISDKNDQKAPINQSLQVDFERQNEEQDQRLAFDMAQTEDSVYHSNKIKIPNIKKENGADNYYNNEEDKNNDDGVREIQEFLNHINSLPIAQSQKFKEILSNNINGSININNNNNNNITNSNNLLNGNQKSADTYTTSQEDTQSSNTFSSNTSNLINSNQYFLKNLSQHQFI